MEEITTALSLIDWKITFSCIAIVAAVIAIFTVAFIRIVEPKFVRIMVRVSAVLIGTLMLMMSFSNPELPYMGNAVYAALAVIIVLVIAALIYLYDWVAYFCWNFMADKINSKSSK